jgi:hypothetical protein
VLNEEIQHAISYEETFIEPIPGMDLHEEIEADSENPLR